MHNAGLVGALITKRAALMDRLAGLQREIEAARSDIAHIEGTIHIFAPDLPLNSVIVKGRSPAVRHFRPSELSRLLLKLLRESTSGITITDLIDAAMASKALSSTNRDARARVGQSVSASLSKLKKRGAVVRAKDIGGVFVWRLAARS